MAVRTKSRSKSAAKEQLYRGVKILRSNAPSRFTDAQIKRAIKHAIAKNAEALSKIR